MNSHEEPTPENRRLDASPDAQRRERLELEKLALEVEDLKRGSHRSWFTGGMSILISLATIAIGVAGFFLNATINKAANQQHDFENYSKLVDDFSAGGTKRIGAIAGLRPFLLPGANRASQTIAILSNDLIHEQDSVAIRFLVSTLQAAGPDAFPYVRASNEVTFGQMSSALFHYLRDELSSRFQRHIGVRQGTSWATYVTSVFARSPRNPFNGYQEFMEDVDFQLRTFYEEHGYGRSSPYIDDALSISSEFSDDPEVRDNWSALLGGSPGSAFITSIGPSGKPNIEFYRDHFLRAAERVLATSEILGYILRSDVLPVGFDASSVNLYNVKLDGRDLSQVDFAFSYISGTAIGTDFAGAKFGLTSIALLLNDRSETATRKSRVQRTNLCGADLFGTEFLDLIPSDLNADNSPNFTGANWSGAHLSVDLRKAFEKHYPDMKGDEMIEPRQKSCGLESPVP